MLIQSNSFKCNGLNDSLFDSKLLDIKFHFFITVQTSYLIRYLAGKKIVSIS